jgi:two-component system KDP operon response regulator KdpE
MAAHPVAPPAAERPPTRTAPTGVPTPAPAPAAATLRILVVDDQPQLIAALSGRLQLEGHTVAAAETGRAGLARLAEAPFDLAIVDLRLPDIEGTEVITAARALADPPYCVLATGMAISASDTELIGGADDVLPKPWTADELRRVLDSAARRRHTTA